MKQRETAAEWTVDLLSNRLMAAVVTFPHGAPPAKAKLVDLMMHTLKAAYDQITAMLVKAQEDKAARGGTLIVHYVLTVPADWDELAKGVMRRAAELAGELEAVAPAHLDHSLNLSFAPLAGIPAAHTSFALEPECAVLSAVVSHSPHDLGPPLCGSNLAIIDAGGSTTECVISTLEHGPSLREVRGGTSADAYCSGCFTVPPSSDHTALLHRGGRLRRQPCF